MAWTLDKNGVTPHVDLTISEQNHLNEFMNEVREDIHPKNACASWDSDYKCVDTGRSLYQFRLSQTYEYNLFKTIRIR